MRLNRIHRFLAFLDGRFRLWGLGLLYFLSQALHAQSGSRWFVTLSPTVTVGNLFEGGKQSIYAPDITGGHHISSMFSPLWGFPNPQYSAFQNLGRKLHMGVQYEYYFNPRLALVTGAELGGRGYIINTDFTNDILVSYRTFAIPVHISHSFWHNDFWALRQNYGTKVLIATSIPEQIDRNLIIKNHRGISPQLYAGLELIHHSFHAPFSFEVGYSHGFTNLIKHDYLGLDYVTPVPIYSTGSAWYFTLKYLVKEKKFPPRPAKYAPNLGPYDLLAYRDVKEPVRVKAMQDSVRVCVVDDQTVDGDSIAIEFNGRIIHKDIRIDREPFCFDLKMEPNGSNTLIVHALNEGKIPPNTCVIYIYQGEDIKEIYIKSDLKTSGAIAFD